MFSWAVDTRGASVEYFFPASIRKFSWLGWRIECLWWESVRILLSILAVCETECFFSDGFLRFIPSSLAVFRAPLWRLFIRLCAGMRASSKLWMMRAFVFECRWFEFVVLFSFYHERLHSVLEVVGLGDAISRLWCLWLSALASQREKLVSLAHPDLPEWASRLCEAATTSVWVKTSTPQKPNCPALSRLLPPCTAAGGPSPAKAVVPPTFLLLPEEVVTWTFTWLPFP